MRLKILFILLILFCSCTKTIKIPASKDASLSSLLPDKNISGKNNPILNKGFGTKKSIKGKLVTYPAMYLYSGDEDIKESFIVGGFDLSKIKSEIKHASLRFYINYSSTTRKDICIFVRPIKKKWNEEKITYLDIYKTASQSSELTNFVEIDEEECLIIIFDIKRNEINEKLEIPFNSSYKTVSINITKIMKKWMKNPDMYHGFLIDPMSTNDFRYITKNEYNQISDFGVIEIASTEWYTWNGNIPAKFKDKKFSNIKNKAENKLKYIPHIVIKTKN